MCGSMADIQSATAEIRGGKKKERGKNKKQQGKNIMVCPIPQGNHKKTTVLWSLYNQQNQLSTGDFVAAKFYCMHAFSDDH